MVGPDLEKGHGAILVPPRLVESNKLGTQQSVDPNSESFLEKKQKLFKYARDKDFKLQGQLKSLLAGIVTDEERRKLCQSRDDRSNTALHYAVKAGNMEVCKQLRKNRADITARGQNKMKPLQFAARYGDEGRAEEVWTCMQWIMEESKTFVKAGEPVEVFDIQEKDRVEICHDRRDRRSCKTFASCVNFARKQRAFLQNLQRSTRFKLNECDFTPKLLKFYTLR